MNPEKIKKYYAYKPSDMDKCCWTCNKAILDVEHPSVGPHCMVMKEVTERHYKCNLWEERIERWHCPTCNKELREIDFRTMHDLFQCDICGVAWNIMRFHPMTLGD